MTWLRSSSCERTRYLAALAPDATLSETEERILSRHLARCASCSSFAASVAAFTSELREAPLAVRERGGSDFVSAFPKRRRRVLRVPKLSLVALTAAAAGALIASVVIDNSSVNTVVPRSPGVLVVYAGDDNDSAALRQLHNISNARRLEPEESTGRPGIFLG